VAALTVAVALTGGLAGCGGSDGSDSATPTATVRRSTTTAAVATTSTTAAPAREDFTAILRDLLARRDEAYEKNDVTILESIYSTKCACLDTARDVVANQRIEGTHAEGPRLNLLRAEVVNRLSPDYVVVRGVVEQQAYNFVDSGGRVVRAGNSHGPLAAIYELGREGDAWRVLGITTEGPVEK